MKTQVLLDFIGELYEASFKEDGDWNAIATRLCELVNARSGAILVEDRVNGTRDILGVCGIPLAYVLAYRFGLSKYDHTFQLQQKIPAGLAKQLIDSEDIKSSHPLYYRLILKANDIGYLGTMNIFQDAEWHVGIGLHRSFESSPFSEEDLALLQSLHPHFRRALNIRKAFAKLRDERATLESALSRLVLGLIIVDQDAKIIFMNPVAQSLLERHLGLMIDHDNRLKAFHLKEQQQLQELIAKILSNHSKPCDLAMGVTHPQSHYAINLLLTQSNPTFCGSTEKRVAIYLSCPDSFMATSTERLMTLYRMTNAEASVAIALANGLSLAQISQANDVSIETIRTQLKQIFQKMGVSKQQDVIRVLLSGILQIN